MFVHRFSRLASLLAVVLSAAPLHAAEISFTPAFQFADLDPAQSYWESAGEKKPFDAARFRDWFEAGTDAQTKQAEEFAAGTTFLLAFRTPVTIGTAQLAAEGEVSVELLPADVKGAVFQASQDQWRRVAPLQTFPDGFAARAARIRITRLHRGPLAWLAWQERWTNLAPAAVGSGEKAPFGSPANAIPLGQSWTNTAPDSRPGAPRQVQRAAVTDVTPSWYLLSWDEPQTIDALWLICNADQFSIYAYHGDPQLNPAIAPDSLWRRVEFQTVHEQAQARDELHHRLLAFSKLKTHAIKLQLTSCHGGAVAQVRTLAPLTSAASAESLAPPKRRGKEFEVAQPCDGELAIVITDADGRPVRNLLAQAPRKRGANVESWDLKDDAGMVVPAGKYRWKAITSPPLGVRYQMSVAPSAPQFFPGRAPWQTGESGPNGWLADHAPITSGAAAGDRVYFGSPGVESGVGLIECDLQGKKLWGKHSFGPFCGVGRLAGDAKSLFIQERQSLHRMDLQTHQITRIADLARPDRHGALIGMAAHEGQVALSFQGPEPWVDNATRSNLVDLEHCLPKFPAKFPDLTGTRRVEPLPRTDFLRLLRLTGTPAGQNAVRPGEREGQFPITLDTVGEGKYQYVMLAFHEPVALGSLVLPNLSAAYLVDVAVHKPNASYPPNPDDDAQWLACSEMPAAGRWTCVAMPPQTQTRGLRLRVRRAKDASEDNLVDDILDESADEEVDPSSLIELDAPKPRGGGRPEVQTRPKENWFASFEGLKLLRRRFEDVTPQAKIRVNSGKINAEGEWDAERSEPLSPGKPGIYVMEWPEPIELTALAIKEIDGAVTEIDVWEDADSNDPPSTVPLDDASGWRKVATYQQARRDAYQPSFTRNDWARYMDGYVSLGGAVKARAVRLRVVEQWKDLNERGTATMRHDRGGRELDRRRCRIYGVAALRYLGDEAPLETLAFRRLELRDGRTGACVREFTVQSELGAAAGSPASLAYGPDGTLYGIQQGRVVRVDAASGRASVALSAIDGEKAAAERLAIGPDGAYYVYVLPDRNIRVYNQAGKLLRTIGNPGGQKPGPWDAEKFLQVEQLVVDAENKLWVVESQNIPRRIVQFDAAGKLVHEFYGNTGYGGGGVLDPGDKTRLFYHQVEFAIDWERKTSCVKNLLADTLPPNCIPIRYEGRTYLAESPLAYSATQTLARVYAYDAERGRATPVSAFGEAEEFPELQAPAILQQIAADKAPSDYTFIWSDRDGDAVVDPEEVAFELKKPGQMRVQLGRFDAQLRCWAGSRVYRPQTILPNGVPIYESANADRAGIFELDDGTLLALGVRSPGSVYGPNEQLENRGLDAQGRVRWHYPVAYRSVSGLYLPPWKPGYVTNEFAIIGHETATAGDLGEFVVVHGNNGQWKIWTADGLLAGQILRHKFDPQSIVVSSSPTAQAGQVFNNLTAGQEHFHGWLAKTPDGKYYIVQGHNYIGLWEVLGLDDFRRMEGEIEVAPEDLRRVRESQEEWARREAKSKAQILECLPLKKGAAIPVVAELQGVKFGLGFDDRMLLLRWEVSRSQHGQLKNSGTEFQRYFKTGACLDFNLGVDPSAPADRNQPVAGDLRLLFTVAEGVPQAVLYQPVAAHAAPSDAWETQTPAAGPTRFDRVVRLRDAQLHFQPEPRELDDAYVFMAAIPLNELGWKPQPGQLLRCDWGLLTSDDGHTVKRRLYWSNSLATGTSDEAWEARLTPHLWGTLRVGEKSQADLQWDQTLKRGSQPDASADIVDDILNDAADESK